MEISTPLGTLTLYNKASYQNHVKCTFHYTRHFKHYPLDEGVSLFSKIVSFNILFILVCAVCFIFVKRLKYFSKSY